MLLFNKINRLIILLIILSITFFFIFSFNSCFKLPPYGYINGYSSLVYSKDFCIQDQHNKVHFKTNIMGARILDDSQYDNFIKVFGDSQVLGLDVKKKSDHYLNLIFPNKNFMIFAAPNNGPYEVLNSLDLNIQDNEDIILTFNASTDFFRLSKTWSLYEHVPLSIQKANLFSQYPLFYDFYKLFFFYINKNETKIFNNLKMQTLFLDIDNQIFIENFDKYFDQLSEFSKKKNLRYDYFITHPYWLYDFNKNNLIINENVYSKYKSLVAELSRNYENIRFSKPLMNTKLKELTYDKRHLRSKSISF